MFLIIGIMMIVAACGDDSNGNTMLTLIKDCTKVKVCNLIPKNLLTKNISRIKLLNIETKEWDLNKQMFKTNITTITYLEISEDKFLNNPIGSIKKKAFRRLPNLYELHIHLNSLLYIHEKAFAELNVLKTLNLNYCKRLTSLAVERALQPPVVPSLENLIISDAVPMLTWNRFLINRTLHKIDVSRTTILVDTSRFRLNVKTCANLRYLNMSETALRRYSDYDIYEFLPRSRPAKKWLSSDWFPNLTDLDISYVDAPFFILIENIHLKVLNISGISKVKSALNITKDGLYRAFSLSWIESKLLKLLNISGISKASVSSLESKLVSLSWRSGRSGVILMCNNQSVEVLELAQNLLEFIDPNALACFENAITINLSENKLFIMIKDHPHLFVKLFRPLNHLEIISLSNNNLSEIPASLFESNTKLRQIDLSFNKLQTINLHVTHLDHLDVLDLENNAIIVLDSASISIIDKLPSGTVVNLISNPLDCSHCADLGFVSWLAKSKTIKREGFTCLRSKTVLFVNDALVAVQMICDEERLSISIPVAFLALVSIIILTFYCIRRQSQKRCRQREIKEIKMIVRKRAMFAVFLTYCSEDDVFVNQYVVDNLNQNLKLVIGTDRDLVCEGDRYFRLGKPIMDEISELLDRSGVLVAVLSNNYCQSVHCRNEFQLAIYKEIPILLMLKETVDPENMSPSMRDMFEKKTRVLWECENGEYKLKTTWLNVCQSVVEMINVKKLRLLTK